jgi:HK97 family phage major capsid protein
MKSVLVEGIDASGGFLTPDTLASEMIDRLRAKGRTFQAGVRTVPMDSDTLMLARLSGGVTPAWKVEGDQIADQTMSFDRVTLKPQTLPLLVKISQELSDDLSPQAASVIEEELLSALALELDRVILRGSGVTPEPQGIRKMLGSISKVALADELWPVLETKIERALERGTEGRVPIVRVVHQAYILATEFPRRNLVTVLERQRRARRRSSQSA